MSSPSHILSLSFISSSPSLLLKMRFFLRPKCSLVSFSFLIYLFVRLVFGEVLRIQGGCLVAQSSEGPFLL